jgi:hypothetical protein
MINFHFCNELFQPLGGASCISTECFAFFCPLCLHVFNLLLEGFDLSLELTNYELLVTGGITFELVNDLFVFSFELVDFLHCLRTQFGLHLVVSLFSFSLEGL